MRERSILHILSSTLMAEGLRDYLSWTLAFYHQETEAQKEKEYRT